MQQWQSVPAEPRVHERFGDFFDATMHASTPDSENHILHISGYDPRAVGGRQIIKLSLPRDFAPNLHNLEVRLRCDLLPLKTSQYRFMRAMSGAWQSILVSFSTRLKEHGQYPLSIEIRHNIEHDGEQINTKRWSCDTVLLLPRSDASLSEIHQVFLATQKNVRVIAEDGAIAKLADFCESKTPHSRQVNIEVLATDGAVAHMDMKTATANSPQAATEVALGCLAWDEELLELAALALHPSAIRAVPNTEAKTSPKTEKTTHRLWRDRQSLRLDDGQQWLLGRDDAMARQQTRADVVIQHPRGWHKRISAEHALIRCSESGAQIIDLSRYGISLNGQRLQRNQASKLQVGDRLELCASFPGLARLHVKCIEPQAIVFDFELGEFASAPAETCVNAHSIDNANAFGLKQTLSTSQAYTRLAYSICNDVSMPSSNVVRSQM